MESCDKACWNCTHYKAYYTKGLCCFKKEENGYCRKHGQIVNKHEQCGCWIRMTPRREKRKIVAMRKLNKIFNDIMEIKQILLEEETKDDTGE